jgi:hypothetical protein
LENGVQLTNWKRDWLRTKFSNQQNDDYWSESNSFEESDDMKTRKKWKISEDECENPIDIGKIESINIANILGNQMDHEKRREEKRRTEKNREYLINYKR